MAGPADYLDYASGRNSPQSRRYDLLGAKTRELSEKPRVIGEDIHLGFRCAWTQSYDSDAGAPDFLSHGFSKGKDEGLARCVDCEVGEGLKGDDGRQIDNGAASPRQHAGQNCMGQRDNGIHIQADFRQFSLEQGI